MEEVKIQGWIRNREAKPGHLRKEGYIPAVIYGRGEHRMIVLKEREFTKFLHEHRAESIIIKLDLQEGKKSLEGCSAVIKEIQHDPVKDRVLHVDFQKILLTEKIKIAVPIKAIGVPVGVKQDGGVLEHNMWEVEIECLPTQIPQALEVNVEALKIGDSIQLKSLSLPDGVQLVQNPDLIFISVVPPAKEIKVEAAVEAAPVAQEPEVIKEKKPKEEAEGEEVPQEK